MADLSKLNHEQHHALVSSVPLGVKTCVLAGAGSGKTRVVVTRITHLLDACNVSPHQIMAMTFTNKAAKEMMERIHATGCQTKGMWVGTFHALCIRLLKIYGPQYNINTFTVMDEDDKLSVIKRIIRGSGMNLSIDDARKYSKRISDCKNELKNPTYVRSNAKDSFDTAFAILYDEYQRVTWRDKMFDFDDLIIYTYLMLKSVPAVKAEVQARFLYVHVDEYQDTNDAQFRLLIELVGHNNLFAVGDDWQSIYGFRSAKPTYIINFEKYFPNSNIVKFQLNYRSTKAIVDAGNQIIHVNKNRTNKTMVAASGNYGHDICVHRAKTSEEEAKFIAGYIHITNMKGIEFKDMAVLYRSNYQSRILEQQLTAASIPYIIVGSISFFDRKEVKDMLAYLRLYVNENDEIAFRRILGLAKGVGKVTIDTFVDEARKSGLSLLEYLKTFGSTSNNKNLQAYAFKASIIYATIQSSMATPAEAIQLVLNSTDYIMMASLSSQYGDQVKENVDELLLAADEFLKAHPSLSSKDTISDFINELALTTTMEREDGTIDAVHLMTIHASKGLEFESVICAGWYEGGLPHANSLGLEESIEEERRLAYVAVSRAISRLLITCPAVSTDAARAQRRVSESRFLKHISKTLIKEV